MAADGVWLVQGTGLAVKDIDINEIHMIDRSTPPIARAYADWLVLQQAAEVSMPMVVMSEEAYLKAIAPTTRRQRFKNFLHKLVDKL